MKKKTYEQDRHERIWKVIQRHKSLYKDKRQAPEIVKAMGSNVRKEYLKKWKEENQDSLI